MGDRLDGMRVAILATDHFEQVELEEPRRALQDEGAKVSIIAPHDGTIRGARHIEPADEFPVDETLDGANPANYEALLLPGGVANPDALRTDSQAVEFVRSFFDANKPVAAICHAPWLLAEAGVLPGRRITSYASLRTDVVNAGAEWVDEAVVNDGNLVTSRQPDDLPEFIEEMTAVFEQVHVRP